MKTLLIAALMLTSSISFVFAAPNAAALEYLSGGMIVENFEIEAFQENGQEGSYGNGYTFTFTGTSIGSGKTIENYVGVTCGGKTETDVPSILMIAETPTELLYSDTIDIKEARSNSKQAGYVTFWNNVCK